MKFLYTFVLLCVFFGISFAVSSSFLSVTEEEELTRMSVQIRSKIRTNILFCSLVEEWNQNIFLSSFSIPFGNIKFSYFYQSESEI